MNKKLTYEAVQVCIDVFENSTLEEIVNLSNRLDEVWKIGKKLKENIDFEDEFDYNYFDYNSDFSCEECVLSGTGCLSRCVQSRGI